MRNFPAQGRDRTENGLAAQVEGGIVSSGGLKVKAASQAYWGRRWLALAGQRIARRIRQPPAAAGRC